jgi:PKD repeat protein
LAAPGEHVVTLIATDAAGNNSQPMTRVFFAEADGAPVPTFLAPARVWSGETVAVDATGSTNDRPDALSCSWEWGDGAGASGCTATHVYLSGGTYPITLTVRDVAGNASTDTRPVLVEQAPVARFSPPQGFANHAMTFDASASDGPSDSTFVWDFGGGELVAGDQVQHVYDADGQYAVTLSVSDPYGHESTVTRTVDVSGDPRPIAAFDAPTGAPLPAESVSFDGTSSSDGGAIVAYRWDFGDGSTASGSRMAHTFAAAGMYQVALEIEDDAGLNNRLVRTIRVDDPPVARLAAPSEAFAGRPVSLDASASSDAHGLAAWSWSFGDGTSGTGAATGHAYSTAGTYQLTLTVVDDDGHTDRRNVTIRISPDNPVSDLVAAAAVSRLAPALSWTAPAGVSVDQFRVYRDGIAVATTPSGAYVDHAAVADGDYQFTVTALLASGDEGTPSAALTVRVDRTAPEAPTDLGATSPTATSPDLTWSPVVDSGSGIATYVVFRDDIEIGRTGTADYTDSDVNEDGTYTYTVRAIDGAGNVGADATPLVVHVDTTPPGAPSGVAGPTPTAAAPELTWTPVASTTAYRVYRDAALVATTADPSYSDSGLAEGRYSYTVSAIDASGNESALSPAHTIIYDTTPPDTPHAPTAASPTSSPVALAWPGAFDANGVDVYQVLRDGVVVANVRGQSWIDGASADGGHSYALRAVDGAGNVSGTSNPVTVLYDATAPSVPSAPAGPAQTRVKPAFSWVASTDAGSGVSAYRIYRGATLVGSTAASTFTDASVSVGGTYRYVVLAVDAAGNVSAPSDAVSIVYDTTAPTSPATPSAPSPTRTGPVITWSGGTDANGIDHYVVVRDGIDIGIGVSPWTDTDPALSDGTHLYAVRAVDPAGNVSSPSSSRAVAYDGTAPSAPGAITAVSPTAAAPALTWAPAADAIGVVRYDVIRDDSPLGSTGGTTFTDSTAGEGTHVYTVRAVDAAGNTGSASEARTVLVDATPPAVPGRPAGPATTNSTVTVSWTAVDDAGSGVDHYLVYRDAVVVATTSALAFADTGLTVDGSYAYAIAAVDVVGNVSARSAARVILFDTALPDTVLSATADLTGPAIDFVFSASEPGSAFECSLDGGAWATCAAPLHVSGLQSGAHAFEVRSTDPAGNQDPTPARRAWVVDAVPPDPPVLTATADATVAPSCRCGAVLLRLTAPGDAIRVRVTRPGRVVLDGAPVDLVDSDVGDGGSYAYQAVAYDAAGNASVPAAASVTTPDRTPPSAPAGPSGSGWPLAIAWPPVVDAATYALRRDGTPLAGPGVSAAADGGAIDTLAPATPAGITAEPTSSTSVRVTWSAVADRGSTYRYDVAASDAAGNWSDWSVESELSSTSGLDRYRVLVDGVVATEVTTPTAGVTGLPPGTTHTVAIAAVDAAGNASPISSAVPVALPTTGVLVVAASAHPQLARPELPITFHADNAGVAAATYRWLFDDDSVAVGAEVTHAFARPGRHVAALTVATPDGTSATASLEVVVDGRPPQAHANVRGSRLVVAAEDDLSGVASISLALGPNAPFAPMLDGGVSLRDGRYSVRVRTEDHAGNAAVAVFKALVDTHAPTLRVRVVGRRGHLVRVRITAADDGSGIRAVLLDRRSVGTRSTLTVLLRPGTRHVVVATDTNGNVARLPFAVPKRR